MKPEKQLLFSVTRDQFDIQFMRGSGNGGQNRNKRDTACRIRHPASGAVATAQEYTGRAVVTDDEIRRFVDDWMKPANLLVEVGDGKHWKPESQT